MRLVTERVAFPKSPPGTQEENIMMGGRVEMAKIERASVNILFKAHFSLMD